MSKIWIFLALVKVLWKKTACVSVFYKQKRLRQRNRATVGKRKTKYGARGGGNILNNILRKSLEFWNQHIKSQMYEKKIWRVVFFVREPRCIAGLDKPHDTTDAAACCVLCMRWMTLYNALGFSNKKICDFGSESPYNLIWGDIFSQMYDFMRGFLLYINSLNLRNSDIFLRIQPPSSSG